MFPVVLALASVGAPSLLRAEILVRIGVVLGLGAEVRILGGISKKGSLISQINVRVRQVPFNYI